MREGESEAVGEGESEQREEGEGSFQEPTRLLPRVPVRAAVVTYVHPLPTLGPGSLETVDRSSRVSQRRFNHRAMYAHQCL